MTNTWNRAKKQAVVTNKTLISKIISAKSKLLQDTAEFFGESGESYDSCYGQTDEEWYEFTSMKRGDIVNYDDKNYAIKLDNDMICMVPKELVK